MGIDVYYGDGGQNRTAFWEPLYWSQERTAGASDFRT